MLAARDQENLVHGHQAAAASKPLNHGARQLGSKTPGNKVPKTPAFKLPLNDENGDGIFGGGGGGGGKTGLKINGNGKNAFATPMGPKSRAPLGAKTTNAKAKAFQTPAVPIKDDLGKTNKKSVSARKPKPKAVPAEMTKLEVLGDNDESGVPDIEYMPPKSKGNYDKTIMSEMTILAKKRTDLPDLPFDHTELNLSMFDTDNVFDGWLEYACNRKGLDGLSLNDHEKKRKEEDWSRTDRKLQAKIQLDMDSSPWPCIHYPECPGEVCKTTFERRREAQEEYDKTIAILDAEAAPKKEPKPSTTKRPTPPSTVKSRAAAAALSKPKTSKPMPDPIKKPTTSTAKPRFGLVGTTKAPPPPTNPSSMRHTAAVAASRTTMGRSKGRVVSNSLKKTINPPTETDGFVPFEERDTSITPGEYYSRYGEPPLGSDMWLECWRLGILKDSERNEKQRQEALERELVMDEQLRKDALDDFQLTLGED